MKFDVILKLPLWYPLQAQGIASMDNQMAYHREDKVWLSSKLHFILHFIFDELQQKQLAYTKDHLDMRMYTLIL
mgnify:CR=1 FL=1